MRIAMFTDSYMPVLNGVSVSIQTLVEELRSRGHSVHVFTSRYPKHKDNDPNIVRFNAIHTPWTGEYPMAIPPFYPFVRGFRRQNFDIVHTHTPYTVGYVGMRWAESENLHLSARITHGTRNMFITFRSSRGGTCCTKYGSTRTTTTTYATM